MTEISLDFDPDNFMLNMGKIFAGGAPSHLTSEVRLGRTAQRQIGESISLEVLTLSWQAVTWVLEQSEAELGSRLVLLSIASHANREGREAHPTLETIGREARLCEREARYCVRALEETGELRVIRGIGRGNSSRYELPFVERWLAQVCGPNGKYAKKGQNLPLSSIKGAQQQIKGAIYDTKRGNDFEISPVKSDTSSQQPLERYKHITVKSVLKSISFPKPSKPLSRPEVEAQKEELRRRGFLQ